MKSTVRFSFRVFFFQHFISELLIGGLPWKCFRFRTRCKGKNFRFCHFEQLIFGKIVEIFNSCLGFNLHFRQKLNSDFKFNIGYYYWPLKLKLSNRSLNLLKNIYIKSFLSLPSWKKKSCKFHSIKAWKFFRNRPFSLFFEYFSIQIL